MLVCLVSAALVSSLHKNAPFSELQVEFYLLGVKSIIIQYFFRFFNECILYLSVNVDESMLCIFVNMCIWRNRLVGFQETLCGGLGSVAIKFKCVWSSY